MHKILSRQEFCLRNEVCSPTYTHSKVTCIDILLSFCCDIVSNLVKFTVTSRSPVNIGIFCFFSSVRVVFHYLLRNRSSGAYFAFSSLDLDLLFASLDLLFSSLDLLFASLDLLFTL